MQALTLIAFDSLGQELVIPSGIASLVIRTGDGDELKITLDDEEQGIIIDSEHGVQAVPRMKAELFVAPLIP